MKKRIIEIIVAAVVFGATLSASLAGMGTVNVTSAETSVLAANDRRRWVILQNNSAADVFVKVDSSTNTLTTANGIKVPAGSSLTITSTGSANPAINAIKAICASGTNSITYSEGNEF